MLIKNNDSFDRVLAFCKELENLSVIKREALPDFTYVMTGYKNNNTPPTEGWRPLDRQIFTEENQHFWFHTTFTTPTCPAEQQLYFEFLQGRKGWDATNAQVLLYLNGHMVQGMDINHTRYPLEPQTEYDLYIYLYTGKRTPLNKYTEFNPNLCKIDKRIEGLFYDLEVPLRSAECLPATDTANRELILKHLNIAVNMLDMKDNYSDVFYAGIADAARYLTEEFYGKVCGNTPAVVSCIGHTHIDVAWKWTLADTREKVQRSFSTVMSLMRQYPEYKFFTSQPQLLQYTKEEAPQLYAEIKQRIQEGRFEVDGAMWLEPDCNLTSGESLVRQIVHGKRFMQEEYGIDSKTLWLPDVFGYSAALPQILKKSGVDTFVTSKISWNDTNQMPYDTFYWQGIDGTEIFTYFLTACAASDYREKDIHRTIYGGNISPNHVLGTWERYNPKTHNTETLLTYGFGDGGGGPTAEMLERHRRLQYGIPGIPKTQLVRADEALARIKHTFKENCRQTGETPRWVGELYLELHRGTYTSMAKNKRNNRKCELLLQNAELWSALDWLLTGGDYAEKTFYKNWQTVLLNQFHDILPGSSIHEVYEDSDRDYARVLKEAGAVKQEKLDRLATNIATDGGLVVYNPNGFTASGYIQTKEGAVYAENIPAMGWRVIQPRAVTTVFTHNDNTLDTPYYLLTLNEYGEIASLYDKENGRQVFLPGQIGNELQLFEDYPRKHDAWDIYSYYDKRMYTLKDVQSLSPFVEGECAGFDIYRKFQRSTLRQRICLYARSRRIDFITDIDWQEKKLLLKAAFPLDVRTDKATYEVQFGHVERPTHQNTSWDAARFEVCGQKWADLSDNGYGVSLLNDCKYGHSTEGSTLKLTLLKCATDPNPLADKCKHTFTYSIYPHAGTLAQADTIQQAYLLNNPLQGKQLPTQSGALPAQFSFIQAGKENIMVETVKKAYDSQDIILRLYETKNCRTITTLTFGFEVAGVWICDLLENEIAPCKVEQNQITLPVKNFEIVTLKVRRKEN